MSEFNFVGIIVILGVNGFSLAFVRSRRKSDERPHLCRNHHCVFYRGRSLRRLLREAVGEHMETIIVGIIALLLFVYLFVAMIRPEKF